MADPDDALELGALRYRIIADAAEDTTASVTSTIRNASQTEFVDLRGRPFSRSERTLWRYLAGFRERGLEGLKPKERKDQGTIRALSREILDRALELRRETGGDDDPLRATKTIIDILEREKSIAPGALKRSTLDRHLQLQGASRRQLRRLGKKVFKKILTIAPFELLVVDFHHGPYVRVPPNGEIRRALLCAFIDHYSRYVPEARYYLHEDYAALRFGFRRLLQAFGLPQKLYRDNGGAFQATRFRVACERLEIKYVASKPYVAEGRGLIERFNGTLKSQFESEVKRRDELPTLDELNAYFAAWLSERYHRDVHSEIDETPLVRFERDALLRPAPDLADVDEFLRLREKRSVHKKWSVVDVAGVRFSVNPALRGRKVHVLYDPSDLAYVLVEHERKIVERALPQKPGATPPDIPAVPSSGRKTDYLELLRTDHEARARAEVSALRLRTAPTAPELALVDLIALTEHARGTVMTPDERALVSAFFRKMRPLEPDATTAALERVQRRLGRALHVRVYLDALETLLVRQRARTGEKR